MNSLTELNTHSQSELTFTDLRDAKVVFDRTASNNQILTISGVTNNDIPNGIEISEIINFSTAACTIRFSILSNASAPLVGSTLTWPSVPAGVTLTTVGQVYTFTGISKVSQWTALKNPDWTLPANYASKTQWGVEVVITYYNETTALTEARTYYVFDPLYFFIAILNSASTVTALPGFRKQAASALTSTFTFNTDAPFTRFVINRSSVFSLAAVGIRAKGLVSNVSSTVVSTAQPNFIFRPSPALTANFSTSCLLGKRRNFVAVLASVAEPNEPGGLSFLIGNGYEYPPGDPLAFLNPGAPWQFPGYLRIRNGGAVPMAVTSTVTCVAEKIKLVAALVMSAGTLTVNAIRTVAPSASVTTSTSTMAVTAVKTARPVSNITTTASQSVTAIKTARLTKNLSTQASLTIDASIPMVLEVARRPGFDNTGFVASLPIISGAVNCVIEWGDGTSTTVTSTNNNWITHTYNSTGTYTIRISGTVERFGAASYDVLGGSNWPSFVSGFNPLGTYLTRVLSFGELGTTSFAGFLSDCPRLISVPTRLTTTVTDLSGMFRFSQAGDQLSGWSASNMQYWNTVNVTKMRGMFYRVREGFNTPISNWNTINVTDMTYMFTNADSFDQNISSWPVPLIATEPAGFYNGNANWTVAERPNWGV